MELRNKGISRRGFIEGSAASVLAACGLAGVSAISVAEEASGASGTATATIPGFGGDVSVTITLTNGVITDCVAVGDFETPERGGRAIASMPGAIIETGTLNIDGVSGASVTSQAILTAGQMAIDKICGITKGAVIGEALMVPGQYTAYSRGYWGSKDLPVTVTVNENSIIDISVPDDRFAHSDTEVMLKNVKETLFPRIIKNQSVKVDAVTGASVTSNGVKMAVENALRQAIKAAGNDESAISRFYTVPVKEGEGQTEIIDCDILFVGLGTAGLFAMRRAIERARELNGGRKVNFVGIDRAGKVGGKSCMTHEYNAINPQHYMDVFNGGKQYIDANEYREMWRNYTMTSSGEQSAKDECVDLFFAESGNAIDWLYFENDWRFGTLTSRAAVNGTVSFNSVYTDRQDQGTMEDRRLAVDGFCRSMVKRCEAQGARIMLETEGYELIMDGDTCKGAKARSRVTGLEYIINAGAVIMNTGGYGLNTELMSTLLAPQYAGSYNLITTGQDTGMMFQAALNAGAGTWNCEMPPMVMGITLPHQMYRFPIVEKPGSLNKTSGRVSVETLNDIPMMFGCASDTMYVNRNAKRFGNEAMVKSFAGDPNSSGWIAYAAGPYYYAIWSTPQVDEIKEIGFTRVKSWQKYGTQGDVIEGPVENIYEVIDVAIEEGLMWKADTLEELAGMLDLDAATLQESYDAYNTYVDAGEDFEFQKDPQYLIHIGEGPYYAVKINPNPYCSGGGLDIDADLRVLKADHETPINGLYALGSDSYGVLLNREKNYCSFGGVAQGWVLTSGYVAGPKVVDYVNKNYGLTIVPEPLSDIPVNPASI
ncbi:MAG: FAD-binding protein [Coriobacteriales bacterium]|nr:FAD-binding protein [Coriobacteriales bacterium]